MSHKYDLIVVSGSSQGLSCAIEAKDLGIENVKIIEESPQVAYPQLIGDNQLEVGFQEKVLSVEYESDVLVVTTDVDKYETSSVVVALNSPEAISNIPAGINESACVHFQPVDSITPGQDILVVGDNDRAVVLASQYVAQGANHVVLSARGMNPDLLSKASHDEIDCLEQVGSLTVLYRSIPVSIDEDAESVYVNFGDGRTPDLGFDQVIFAPEQKLVEPNKLGITDEALSSGRLKYVCDPRLQSDLPSGTVREVTKDLAKLFGIDVDLNVATHDFKKAVPDLRDEFYNATITYFEKAHSDLWVLRVSPDASHKGIKHKPGQYVTMALGYWEERIDDVIERKIDEIWDKMARRSYSISNRIFTDDGYLASETQDNQLEFYIVLVRPSTNKIPEFTPRLALKKPGDRIFLGGTLTGHYTLEGITNPQAPIVFLATGTGEAPHNSMVVELLKRGHTGPIVSAVNVRKFEDLGYKKQHEELMKRYSNYHYLGLPTRENNVPKRYMQDLLVSGDVEELLGAKLDPDDAHVFACGNPSMVGAPNKKTGELPDDQGIVGILLDRGFTIDSRRNPGNIHFESFWD